MNAEAHSYISGIVEKLWERDGNRLWQDRPEPAWGKPLIGVCRGDDPVFARYKEVVGPIHWTPEEVFRIAFPGVVAEPAELAVISWILPQTEATRRDNAAAERYPAERWARSRIFGERFNHSLRIAVAEGLTGEGIPAVAPMALESFSTAEGGPFGRMSTWSERHAAYACGLGTFGLCDGLITPVGKAIRAGSVVARMNVDSSARPYEDHHAYCLHYARGTCGTCIERCPAGAISAGGHDKELCAQYLATETRPYVTGTYGFEGYGCGLCQTGVPCESGIPKELLD